MRFLRRVSVLAAVIATAACGTPTVGGDASSDARADGRTDLDATTSDSAVVTDSAAPEDGSAPPMDSAVQSDSAVPSDSGVGMDASTPTDSAVASDSATDAGGPRTCATAAECGPGQACQGIAACGARGVCGGITPCPAVVDPVCGCDRRTYSNRCVASNASVGVLYPGACTDGGAPADAGAGCRSNGECTRSEVCLGIASCGATGLCGRARACPDVVIPVCGCDGRTYNNSCELDNAGVGMRAAGACPDAGACMVDTRMGCCLTDSDCGGRGYCAPLDSCTGGRATGVCKTRPSGAGQCWRDSDCPSVGGRVGRCSSPRICPCGAMCLLADAPGTCV